jgi:O-antigen/teichoic acid export membrane protein
VAGILPGDRFGDHRAILAGTGQNIVGLGVFVLATFGTNVLIARVLGDEALGVITLTTQLAFVGGAATRFGMDMAATRLVAIDVGKGEPGRARGVVARAAAISGAVSLLVALPLFLGAGALSRVFTDGPAARGAFQAAALALPFVALCQVYLGGTRGLRVMRHTLYVYWAGQPLAWIGLMAAGWILAPTAGMGVLAYALSWILGTAAAWLVWRRETTIFPVVSPRPGEVTELVRYGAPRAPAALLSQGLFWADYFVLSLYVSAGQLGVYAAAVRVAQALVLFLVAVNYMFSPFVADLHARGERERLEGLNRTLTRWILAATIPLLLVLLVVPGPVLLLFGGEFETGTTALRILLIGQFVNMATGSVGFILIMVGRTGWDLIVYAATFALDVAIAFLLAPVLGPEGAAIAQSTTLALSKLARVYLVWRFLGIHPFDHHYFRLAIPAVAGGIAMLAVHLALEGASWPVDLVVSAAVGTAVYVAVLLLTALTPTERAMIGGLIGRRR